MTSVSPSSLLAIGFVLGLRHALDADHLAAISTIVTERRSLPRSSLVGAMWGLGHTLALLIAGASVIVLHEHICDRLAHLFEFGVGIMLVLLGANALRTVLQGDGLRTHCHTPGQHSHSEMRLGARPLLVGMVHGLAGSAPLTLLILTVMPSRLVGLFYLVVFGAGAVMGMTIMTTLVSMPAQLTAARHTRAYAALRGVAGVFSVVLGVFIVCDNAVLTRLT